MTGPKAPGIRHKPSSFGVWDLGFGLFSLLLYSLTLSKDILPADGGEFQVVGAALGVAHPPGFALYTLLSWLATRLLFSAAAVAPAAAINFLSAVTASLTLVFLSRAVQRLTQSRLAGISSALALGFSTTFWAQATTANVRMLTAFATALALDLITQYRLRLTLHAPHPSAPPLPRSPASSKFDSWNLGLIFLTLGLGVSHHGSLIFVAAILGLYTLWLNPSILRRPWPLLGGLLPFLAWLYFPLRAGAFGAPPRIATVNGLLEHILAAGFRGDIFFFANLKDLPDRLLIFGNILTFQFVWPLLVLTAFGGLAVLWRDRQSGVLLAAFAVHTFISMTYKSPQTVEYLLPAYVFLAALLGYAFAELFRFLRLFTTKSTKGKKALSPAPTTQLPDHPITPTSLLPRLLTGLLAALPIALQFNATFPSYLTLAQDASTRDYAQSLLTSAPPNAVILASWHWATPLWYLQTVEGQRPDVEVKYVYPRTASLADDWAAEINAALPRRPVIVTSFYAQEFAALPYRFIPLGPAWQVRAEPLLTPPEGLTGARTFGDWEFLGYHLASSQSVSSVQSVDLTAAWRLRPNARPHAISFFVQIIGPDGLLYGQKDVAHPSSRYVPGEVLLDRYPIVLRPDTPPGDYALVAGAYLPDGTRLAEARLTAITITARSTPPVTLHPLSRATSGATLVGYDVDRTLPDSPRLYLHWKLGPQPATATVLDAPLALPTGPGYLTTAHDFTPGQPLTISNLQLLIPNPQSRYVPLDNSILLTSAALSPSGPLHPGQTLTVDLRFLAARPITEDDAVSLKLFGNGWFVQSDVTPAGGAIPTLKWITGSRIADRHRLIIPPDASPGSAQLMLTLYDAFTQRNLALLDPRLALLGPAVPLGSIEIIQP